MDYFIECGNSTAIKNHYRELMKLWHPDMHTGADADKALYTTITQTINAQFAYAMNNAVRHEKPGKTEQEYTDMAGVNEAIRKAVESIINLPAIEIEICGLWVWVGGNTREVKDALKAAGYRWAAKKLKWYYAGVPASSRGRFNMDDIRSRYGSEKVNRKEDEKRNYQRIA